MWSKLSRFSRELFGASPSAAEQQEQAAVRILFVCMGNVCRSPLAQGALRRMLESAGLTDQVYVESAGTHTFHIGAPPDNRCHIVAGRRGIDLQGIRARRLREEDFARFDYLLAMDQENYEFLRNLCPEPEHAEKVQLFLSYAPHLADREVPDPYYGSMVGFERVMDLVEAAAEGLLLHLRERYRL